MKKLLYLLTSLFWVTLLSAQLTPTTILGNNALVYQPDKATYGVSIMFQGTGEAGSATIDKLYLNGFAHFIQSGFKPPYAVIAVQQKNTWITPAQTDALITEILHRYPKIDPLKVNLTGLSAGAKACFIYVLASPAYAARINSIVVMSMPIVESSYLKNLDSIKSLNQWHLIGNQDTHTAGDFYHPELSRVQYMKANKWPSVRYTEWNGGHSGWNTYYNPIWKDTDGVSIDGWIQQMMNGCQVENTQEQTPVIADKPTSVLLHVNATKIRVYPNTVLGTNRLYVFVTLPVPDIITVEVKDSKGNLVKNISQAGEAKENQVNIEFADLPPGPYLIIANGLTIGVTKK